MFFVRIQLHKRDIVVELHGGVRSGGGGGGGGCGGGGGGGNNNKTRTLTTKTNWIGSTAFVSYLLLHCEQSGTIAYHRNLQIC